MIKFDATVASPALTAVAESSMDAPAATSLKTADTEKKMPIKDIVLINTLSLVTICRANYDNPCHILQDCL